jgi:hypothetical protein
MARGAKSKWELLGEILGRCCGPINMPNLQAGINASVAENIRSGPREAAVVDQRPTRRKKQPAAMTT